MSDTVLDLLWTQGSPDNANDAEHCVVMTREGLLDDRSCDDIYPFVCKMYGNNTKYNTKCDNFDIGTYLLFCMINK